MKAFFQLFVYKFSCLRYHMCFILIISFFRYLWSIGLVRAMVCSFLIKFIWTSERNVGPWLRNEPVTSAFNCNNVAQLLKTTRFLSIAFFLSINWSLVRARSPSLLKFDWLQSATPVVVQRHLPTGLLMSSYHIIMVFAMRVLKPGYLTNWFCWASPSVPLAYQIIYLTQRC